MKFTLGTSMWFWSVFWPTNCPVNFPFFLVGQKKLTCLRDWTIFLCPIFKKDWTKNSRVDKKNCLVSETRQFSFGRPKKMRNWPDNWSAKETDQYHMDAPRNSNKIGIEKNNSTRQEKNLVINLSTFVTF